MTRSKSLSLVSLALSLAACGDPALAEIAAQAVTLSVSGVTSEPETVAVGESQGGLGIERAVVRVSAMTLSACRESTADLTLAARAYDLLSEPRQAETVLTAVRELCRLRIDVDSDVTGDVEGAPTDTSLYVAGSDGEGEPVEWSSQSSLSLLFEAEPGDSFGVDPLLVGFDLARWLESSPTPDESVEEARERFEAQLFQAAALYVDLNGDGSIDDDEQTPIARASSEE